MKGLKNSIEKGSLTDKTHYHNKSGSLLKQRTLAEMIMDTSDKGFTCMCQTQAEITAYQANKEILYPTAPRKIVNDKNKVNTKMVDLLLNSNSSSKQHHLTTCPNVKPKLSKVMLK